MVYETKHGRPETIALNRSRARAKNHCSS
jgi:hypothetical protein